MASGERAGPGRILLVGVGRHPGTPWVNVGILKHGCGSQNRVRVPQNPLEPQQKHSSYTELLEQTTNASVSRTASKTLKTRLSARARDHTRFITDDSSLTIGPRGRRAPGRVTRSTTTRTATTPIALIMVAVPLVASTPPKFTATTGPISAWIPATSRASKATQQKIWKASPSS